MLIAMMTALEARSGAKARVKGEGGEEAKSGAAMAKVAERADSEIDGEGEGERYRERAVRWETTARPEAWRAQSRVGSITKCAQPEATRDRAM